MKITYCTIASANYLSRVQVLEKTLKAYNPGANLEILLCERPLVCEEISRKTGRSFYSPTGVGCDQWLHMAFYYNVTEYNTSLKPFFLETLFKKGYDAVFYFDPDIEVFGSLKEMESLVSHYDIVLTPHVCRAVPNDNKTPLMESYIRAGQFNLGYMGISNSAESLDLIRWWQSVCVEKCIHHPQHKYFVDQFWADIFPSLVEKAHILRDPQYNVAYWNLFQRRLEFKAGKWYVEGKELKFFHFSGLAKNDLTKISIYQNRITAPKESDVYQILSQYFKKIREQEWSQFDSRSYSFGTYTNGTIISDSDRKNFLYLNFKERKTLPNPFDRPDIIQKIIRIKLDDSDELAVFAGFLRPMLLIRTLYNKHLKNQINSFVLIFRADGTFAAIKASVMFFLRKLRKSEKTRNVHRG